jgi:hypothetical protein
MTHYMTMMGESRSLYMATTTTDRVVSRQDGVVEQFLAKLKTLFCNRVCLKMINRLREISRFFKGLIAA